MKFRLLFSERFDYSIPIEAKNINEANDKAEKMTSEHVPPKKFIISRDVTFFNVEEVS